MSIGELFFIGIVILLVVPPEKLPGLAREAARLLNEIRRSTSGVWEELKKDVPNPMEDLRREKQKVDDYLKFIGSPSDHKHDQTAPRVSQPAAAPSTSPVTEETTDQVASKPVEVATSAPPDSSFVNKPTFVIESAVEKNESDPTKK